MSWRGLLPSADGTHHVRAGVPAYADRFDEVLKFHEPGLAPVRRGAAAWHIDPAGVAAYVRRFQRTFGFYEGLAAVESGDGWHHVAPDGANAFDQRFAWCGNFQGGRATVRARDGRYHHILPDGRPCYAERWCYAGDYRDDVAVVKRHDGLATHIDLNGRALHDRWFVDLDVFHKGHARARDREGWFHIDARGEALYGRRFASVEPFYNEQAFAELHDGSQAVIGHDGVGLVQVSAPWSGGRAPGGRTGGRRLLLVGLAAAGKTTVGRALAARWGVELVSLDDCRRRWGDGTTAGDHLARAMFLRTCATLDAGVFETSGAGPYRHATRAALAERRGPLVVCWLDAPANVRRARRDAPPRDIPHPPAATGGWSEADAEAALTDDIAHGWWTLLDDWRAHRVDATVPADELASTIDALVSGTRDP